MVTLKILANYFKIIRKLIYVESKDGICFKRSNITLISSLMQGVTMMETTVPCSTGISSLRAQKSLP